MLVGDQEVLWELELIINKQYRRKERKHRFCMMFVEPLGQSFLETNPYSKQSDFPVK